MTADASGVPPAKPEPTVIGSALSQLAGHVSAMATGLGEVEKLIRQLPEPYRGRGWRLAEAGGSLRSAAEAIQATLADLELIASRPAVRCSADWGCCPQHGNTLASSGGESWCQLRRCGLRWPYDRLASPCDEPPAWRITDMTGAVSLMCAGHAMAAREQLEGARFEEIGDGS